MTMQIINKYGQLIGIAKGAYVPHNMRNGDYISLILEQKSTDFDFEALEMEVTATMTLDIQPFKLYTVPIYEGEHLEQLLWFLMAPDKIPEKVWKAGNFIDLRQAWPEVISYGAK